jgi:DNA-binding MarR family transcriptional regulator
VTGEHGRATSKEIRALTYAVERLRLAQARLRRQRSGQTGLNDTDRAAVRYLAELGDDGVEATPTMIADQLDLSPSSVTALVDRLVAKGLVSVVPHPADRRSKHILAFDRTIEPDRIDPLTARLREISASLTPPEATLITEFIDRVTEAVRTQG